MNRVELPLLREILSVAQVGLAVLAVWIGTGGSWWAIVGAIVLTAVAYARPLPTEPSPAVARMWTVLVFFALVASVARGFLRLEILDAGIDFLLLLCVQRFFNRQKTREHLQLQMLAAVLMVLAAVINTELSFPLILLVYLPLAVMGLQVNLLMGEGERLGQRVQYELRRTGKERQGLLWTSALQVAGAAAVVGLFVFMAFPRFGVGVFLRGSLPDRTQSGFSEQVRLGGFGTIKSDATVVMRIEVGEDTPIVDHTTWHLRGSAFDRYQDGLWSHSGEGERPEVARRLRFRIIEDRRGPLAHPPNDQTVVEELPILVPNPIEGFDAYDQTVRGTVILEDIGTNLLFAPAEPLAVGLSPRGGVENLYELELTDDRQFAVERRRLPGEDDLGLSNRPLGPVRYVFFSRPTRPTPDELRAVGEPPVGAVFEPYLQVSPTLSPEVGELARRIVGDADTRYDKVTAIGTWLGDLDYTLDQPRSERVDNGADPLEGFLFDTRAGHCEYFATAMAVLLREVGVPTRNVNGYYGAEWNPVGEFYTVRQADAHSWVEVYFEDLGWVTFDPTPPSGRNAGQNANLFPRLAQAVDALRNAYLGYVIDYDLGTQLAVLEGLGMTERDQERGPPKINWKTLAWWTTLPIALVAVGLGIRWLRRRASLAPEVAAYKRVLAALSRRGFPRQHDESARRLAERLRADDHAAAGPMATFARLYERLRFGPPRSAQDLEALRRAADEVLRAVRSA